MVLGVVPRRAQINASVLAGTHLRLPFRAGTALGGLTGRRVVVRRLCESQWTAEEDAHKNPPRYQGSAQGHKSILNSLDASWTKTKKATLQSRMAFGEVLRGGGKFNYMDGAPPAAAGDAPAMVLVIRRTSTRRLAARPSRVLFGSAGLSLPNPIT